MTNSAKQTTKKAKQKAGSKSGNSTSGAKAGRPGKLPITKTVGTSKEPYGEVWLLKQMGQSRLIHVSMFLVGCLVALHINRWHFGAPVVLLWLAWGSILFTAATLWRSGWAIAHEGEIDSESFDLGSRHRELTEEKRSLLVAIKEIEFDRELGKMSPTDAKEIMAFYRGRAIEVIKELDGLVDDDMTIEERIARDLKAHHDVHRATAVKQRKVRPVKKAEKDDKVSDSKASESADKNGEKTESKKPDESGPEEADLSKSAVAQADNNEKARAQEGPVETT